jgi:hypothetical protein
MSERRTVKLGEIITEPEVQSLRFAVSKRKDGSPHAAILAWVNARPEVLARWEKLELLPSYAAYLLEYYLNLS